jgi:hypothetical protein
VVWSFYWNQFNSIGFYKVVFIGNDLIEVGGKKIRSKVKRRGSRGTTREPLFV